MILTRETLKKNGYGQVKNKRTGKYTSNIHKRKQEILISERAKE